MYGVRICSYVFFFCNLSFNVSLPVIYKHFHRSHSNCVWIFRSPLVLASWKYQRQFVIETDSSRLQTAKRAFPKLSICVTSFERNSKSTPKIIKNVYSTEREERCELFLCQCSKLYRIFFYSSLMLCYYFVTYKSELSVHPFTFDCIE